MVNYKEKNYEMEKRRKGNATANVAAMGENKVEAAKDSDDDLG